MISASIIILHLWSMTRSRLDIKSTFMYKIEWIKFLFYLHLRNKQQNTTMKGTHLGEFEEIVLLAIAALQYEAYGLMIKRELEEQTARKITISAVHTACNRLEEKGYLEAEYGEKSAKRGGKRKKIYRVNLAGQNALRSAYELRQRMWGRIKPEGFQIDLSC